jgi:hypothetical protein
MSERNFLPASGQSFSGGKRHWGVYSPRGPAWWRLSDKRNKTRLFGSMKAADRAALGLEKTPLPTNDQDWQKFGTVKLKKFKDVTK